MRPPRLLGAVLAGGRSRRYGQPKHAVPVGGVPMLARAIAVLEASVDEVVVVSPRTVEGSGETPVIPDRIPGRGPLGGLHAALHHARDRGLDGVFLLACDLPLVGPEVVAGLLEASMEAPARPRDAGGADADATPGRVSAAVAPERAGGGVEPLCAVYPVGLMEVVEARLLSDDLSLHALLREVDGRSVDLGSEAFLNVNTPRERDEAEATLAEREGP